MLTIGMLGGMSWQSSAEYYRLTNELVSAHLGGLHSARCILYSVDLAEIEEMQVSGRWHDAGRLLGEAARSLQTAGADLLLLCTNTMHRVADQVRAAVTIPLLDIVDLTASAVRSAEVRSVGLIGTAFIMEQSFYRDRLAAAGLTVHTPSAGDRELIHRIIFDELCHGVLRDSSRGRCEDVIRRLKNVGAQGVILGSSEVELLIRPETSPLPVFPTTRLHVTAAVEWSLAGGPPADGPDDPDGLARFVLAAGPEAS